MTKQGKNPGDQLHDAVGVSKTGHDDWTEPQVARPGCVFNRETEAATFRTHKVWKRADQSTQSTGPGEPNSPRSPACPGAASTPPAVRSPMGATPEIS